MAAIRFRCIRCQHALKATENAVGEKMYCPVCYFQLTVPAESTVKDVDPTQLYNADDTPIDVREMKDRQRFVSLPCSVCHTNIAVTKEQIGHEIVCPECDTKIVVPEEIGRKFDSALNDKLDKIMLGLNDAQQKPTYGVRMDASGEPAEDWSKRYPVYCKLCATMMYASEDQVGQELTCPDCDTKTVVPPRPEKISNAPLGPLSFEGGASFGLASETENAAQETPGTGNLVPVVCSLCGTRMYARESQIGEFKTCPDCGRQTEIKAVPKNEMLAPEILTDGYDIDAETIPPPRPVMRTLVDYRYVDGSLDKPLYNPDPPKKSAAAKPTKDRETDLEPQPDDPFWIRWIFYLDQMIEKMRRR